MRPTKCVPIPSIYDWINAVYKKVDTLRRANKKLNPRLEIKFHIEKPTSVKSKNRWLASNDVVNGDNNWGWIILPSNKDIGKSWPSTDRWLRPNRKQTQKFQLLVLQVLTGSLLCTNNGPINTREQQCPSLSVWLFLFNLAVLVSESGSCRFINGIKRGGQEELISILLLSLLFCWCSYRGRT